jgi:hypothetical protein
MSDACEEVGTWSRLRAALGPTLVGLAGGALLGLAALPSLAPLCRSMATTYDRYPSMDRPWLATEVDLPGWLQVVAVLVGLAGPVALGAVTVWLSRPRDAWADLSAGLTTALAATLAAFVSCVGWPVVLALVVVPSIADLTLLGEVAEQPTPADAAAPLLERYPDLDQTEPKQRGGVFTAKVVSDQVAGSMHAVWVGVLLAALSAGSLALSGSLAAGYLWRRGDSLRLAALPYLEITVPLTVTLSLVVVKALTPVWSTLLGDNPYAAGAVSLAGLASVAVLMIAGVVRRWPWLLRVCLALTWLMLLVAAWPGSRLWLPAMLAAGLTGILLGLRFLGRPAPVAVAGP